MADLLDFGASPAPAAEDSGDFGAFQGSSAPAPAAAGDDFADFDQIGSKNKGPDPFATAAAPAPQPAAFDAFGNSGGVNNNMMNNNMMGNNMMNNNMMGNNMMNNNNNMAAMGNAFSNMSVGNSAPVMQQQSMPASNDDDFGDFTTATPSAPSAAAKKISSDPMAGLINLDGLSKNASKKMTMNQPVQPDAAAAQYQQAMQNGVQNGGQAQQGKTSEKDVVFVFFPLNVFNTNMNSIQTICQKAQLSSLQAAVMPLVP